MSKQHSQKPATGKDKINEIFQMYAKVFNTDAGQRVLEDLRKSLKYGQTLYNKGQSTEDLHYEMGRQSVFNDILYALKKNE